MLEKLGNIAVFLFFFVLFLRSRGSIGPGLFQIIVGLFILAGLVFYFYLKGKARRDAAQARRIDTRYQYTVPKSQGQTAKSLVPLSSSVIIPPQKDDVVVEQKSAPSPDRDKSQVMPPDYYKILGINHSADLQNIKQAAQTQANKIKTAFAVLSHADQRTAYDVKPNLGPHNHYATLLVKKLTPTAKIKVAAQARMKEIKEAYENLSKPETRAAYDSQWQAAKAPIPHSPPIPLPPKMEKVVVEQKPVPPLDKDKSQVSPYRPPTVSLGPNRARRKDRDTTEIELAERGTRLLAVIVDIFILAAPLVFMAIFLDIKNSADILAKVFGVIAVLSSIGITMTDLVLVYRHGQTLGKRLFSIKIVDADGSRAGLLQILLVRTWGIPFLSAILAAGLNIPIIGTLIALLDHLAIFQNSRRCLHDLIANTIVVKVFPGKNDTAYGSLTGAIGVITLKVVMPVLFVAVVMIPAYSDYLRRGKVAEAIAVLNAQKAPVENYLASHDSFPPLGRKLLLTESKYTVNLVSNSEEFYFEATMSKEDTVLGDQIVRLIYHPDTKTWSCSAAYPNGIPQKYLPSECKE